MKLRIAKKIIKAVGTERESAYTDYQIGRAHARMIRPVGDQPRADETMDDEERCDHCGEVLSENNNPTMCEHCEANCCEKCAEFGWCGECDPDRDQG